MRVIKTGVILVVGLLCALRGIDWLTSFEAPQLIGRAIRRVPIDARVVALTFDDGPCHPSTGEILDLLAHHRVPATFFVVGKHIEKHPELVQRMVSEGHQVGNHSYSHRRLIFKTPALVRHEIERTDELIRSLGYRDEIVFRAPYGRKLFTLPAVLSAQNRRHVLFDVIAKDWRDHDASVVTERILSGVRPGSIILLHDGGGDRRHTVDATGRIISSLRRQGYRFVTVADLLSERGPGAPVAGL